MTRLSPTYAGIGVTAALAAGGYALSGDSSEPAPTGSEAIVVPVLTTEQETGRILFDANCAACHGSNASGSDQGPPLVHRIYEPSHYGDMAFVLAARQGVRALQRANGIN